MLYRAAEKLILPGLFLLVFCLTGCATAGRLNPSGTVPADMVPDDFNVFARGEHSFLDFQSVRKRLYGFAAEKKIPSILIDRTRKFSVVSIEEGFFYLAAEGNYPDHLIIKALRDNDEWVEKKEGRFSYFFSGYENLAVMPVVDDNFIVFSGDRKNIARRAQTIAGIIRQEISSPFAGFERTVFHVRTKKIADGALKILPAGFNNEVIRNGDADIYYTENSAASFFSSIYFEDEKSAAVFVPMFRLSLAEYLRRFGIADIRTMREMNMVSRDGNCVRIFIEDVPVEKLDLFIGELLN